MRKIPSLVRGPKRTSAFKYFQRSTGQEDLIRSLEWPTGRVQTCIAGESGVIRSLRDFLANEKHVPRDDTYISGYWKIGLIEDEHQQAKRAGNT